ncbi:hypothetical protein WT66_30980 [Burkholderia stagnalis]|uniref:Uncharacterized protein n=1 Tax=Burkholderia vietnamiensis TaxID=60552 RepID=A0AA44Y575_BURVI|nr:hypothetical protein WT18_25460 [Burkholderia stagnalis]KVS21669.1 hypothetical protein WK32_18460 [Burkholderia vietnamiensis]KVP04083.1 hypothetical protein WT20_28760 [Burkholderia stagnalis]KVW93088.1 hypothetical protein WT30_21320 [Burkholderia stagnalis]KWH67543.1 hypothetical protein WT66_30980 [Burkholderia stagnalis]
MWFSAVRLYRNDQAAQPIRQRLGIPGEQVKVCRFQSIIDSSNHLAVLGLSWRSVVERDANLTEAYFATRDQTEAFAFGFGMWGCDGHPGVACCFTQCPTRPVVLQLRVYTKPFRVIERYSVLMCGGMTGFDFFHHALEENCGCA